MSRSDSFQNNADAALLVSKVEEEKKQKKAFDKPLHPEEIEKLKKDLTKPPKISKNKKTPGRPPSGNVSIYLRVPQDIINNLDKRIHRANSKGLGIDQRETIIQICSYASNLSQSEFEKLIIDQRISSSS